MHRKRRILSIVVVGVVAITALVVGSWNWKSDTSRSPGRYLAVPPAEAEVMVRPRRVLERPGYLPDRRVRPCLGAQCRPTGRPHREPCACRFGRPHGPGRHLPWPEAGAHDGCTGCYDYGFTEGRINDIVVDPTTTTNGSIVAYAASVGGGVWKTTNCCSSTTTWAVTTDDPLISTIAIDTLSIDPNDHNTIYAGTGDLNYGSFSMGSQGILKSTNAGATWTVLGADVFGPGLPAAAGPVPAVRRGRQGARRPEQQQQGRRRARRRASSSPTTAASTGPGPARPTVLDTCARTSPGWTDRYGQRSTRIIAAVGLRGFATTVQYDLGLTARTGSTPATMPRPAGARRFTSITSNANGFVYGNAVTGSPYPTGASMNAASGVTTPTRRPATSSAGSTSRLPRATRT